MRSLLSRDDLNDEGRSRFEALKSENEKLETDIARAEYLHDAERRMAADPRDLPGDGTFERECRQFSLLRAIASQVPGLNVEAGRELEVSKELQTRSGRQHQGVTVPRHVFETRVVTTAAPVGGPGSNIVATDHRADQYIDLLRSRLIVRRLGARILSGLSGNLDIPKLKASATVGWVAENAALSASDAQFEKVQLSPKHCGALVEFSRNMLMQSSPDVEALVRADFAAIIAEAIDSVAINGGGSDEPSGVLQTSGIGSVTFGSPSWAGVLEFISDVEVANSEGSGWATRPEVVKTLRSTLKESDSGAGYLQMEPNSLAGYPLVSTTLVPNNLGVGTDKSALIFGNWSDLIVGYWSEFDVLVNPFESTAYSKGNVQVRGMATCDIAVRHPASFSAAKDI
jgi:HK97 family phage major capsid protein